MRSRRKVRRSKSKTRRKQQRSRSLRKRSRVFTTFKGSRSSNKKILQEYERLLFQPISQSNTMLPSNVSKHELVKQATYGGYSYNSSRRSSKPQLRTFLQQQQVPSEIQNPFQKVCGPSKSSIAYPVVYTKDELIRHALQKGHQLDQVSSLSVPRLCDLLNLSGKPIFIKPLQEITKKTLNDKSTCANRKKSHLIRLAVKHGYSRAVAQRATKKDLCDILGIESEGSSSKTNAVISKTISATEYPEYSEKISHEIEDASSCELFSSQGEAYCNEIKLRSTKESACEYDKATQVCRMKKLIPVNEPVNKESLQQVNDKLEAKLVVEEKKLEEAKEEKETLEELKESAPPYQQEEIQKKIDETEKVIDSQEAKVEKTEENLKLVADAAQEQGVVLDTNVIPEPKPIVSSSPVSLLSSEEIKQIEARSPDNAIYQAYRKNDERYKQLQLIKQDLVEQQRKNERDIHSDNVSGLPEDDPARQQRLAKRGILLDKIAQVEQEELSILSEMAKQLESLRKDILSLPFVVPEPTQPVLSSKPVNNLVNNPQKSPPTIKPNQEPQKKSSWFSNMSQKFKSAVKKLGSPTSKSLGLYVPNAIHTRLRIRRSRL